MHEHNEANCGREKSNLNFNQTPSPDKNKCSILPTSVNSFCLGQHLQSNNSMWISQIPFESKLSTKHGILDKSDFVEKN